MVLLKQIFRINVKNIFNFCAFLTVPTQKNSIKELICILLEYLNLLALYKTVYACLFFHFNLLVALFLLLLTAGSSHNCPLGPGEEDFIAMLQLFYWVFQVMFMPILYLIIKMMASAFNI